MSVRIHSIKLSEAPPTREMFIRPWAVTHNNFQNSDHLLTTLSEVTQDGTNLSANALAPVANQILVPDARANRLATIGGSYSDRRFAIEIVVETINSQMMSQFELISGYTDQLGFSDLTGQSHIDDQMLIFVNGVSDLAQEKYNDGMAAWNIRNITQVLSPVIGAVHHETQIDQMMVAARPTDALAVMASQAMSGHSGNRVTVNSMLLTAGNRRNMRSNNTAASYLSATASSYRNELLDSGDSSDSALLNAAANPNITEPAMTQGNFLRELRTRTGYQQDRAIHWSDLRRLDPSLTVNDSRITVIPLTARALQTYSAVADGAEHWNSAYNETLIAQQAICAIPAFMSSRLLGELDIEAHNATVTGETVVVIHSMRGIRQDIDMTGRRQQLTEAFSRLVFSQLVGGTGNTLYIRASMALAGIANIIVEINGGGKRPFNAPVFNDASYSPCLAENFSQLQNLSSDLSTICAATTNRALSSTLDYAQVVSGTSPFDGGSAPVGSGQQNLSANNLPPLGGPKLPPFPGTGGPLGF